MCGITGFWAPGFSVEKADEVVEAMNAAVRHRGPDGAGVWRDSSAGVVFGHRRLAILDLSPAGHQPMVSSTGRYVLTFNGEIYNYRDVRETLEKEGLAPKWRGTSDTEVMLAALEAWGLEAALERFVGMFALGLWDTRERRLHLIRDRVGVKPLYWSRVGNAVCFASELKSLRCFPGFDTTIDRAALSGYLGANCVPDGRCIFAKTAPVAAGTIVTSDSGEGRPKTTRYWDPSVVVRRGITHPFAGSDWDAIDAVDRMLRSAVSLRMVSDVPLGAFLSGGIDSSTVVALMQAQSDRPVHTFSIENESTAFDEGRSARAVAKHLGTDHTPLMVTAKDALDVIPLLPSMYDEPFADSSQIPTYLVARLARRQVTVALSGDGGDEAFGGYVRHIWGPRIWALRQRLPSALLAQISAQLTRLSPDEWGAFFDRLGPVLPRLSIPGIRMHKLASVLMADSPQRMYEILASHWLPNDSVLAEGVFQESAAPTAPPAPPAELDDDVAGYMMYRDLVGYMAHDILTKVDRATMAVSLEAREPLTDHRLIELAWSLKHRVKVRGPTGKWILRQVLKRYVPLDLVTGPKTGFGIPLAEWLRGPLRDWAEPLIAPERLKREGYFNADVVSARWKEHLAGTRPWEYHLWDILMFQAWTEALHLA